MTTTVGAPTHHAEKSNMTQQPIASSPSKKLRVAQPQPSTPKKQQKLPKPSFNSIDDQLSTLHSLLQLSHLPSSLPSRLKQLDRIRRFLHDHIDGGVGGSLYLSGGAGLGKTSSVDHVVWEMYGKRLLEFNHQHGDEMGHEPFRHGLADGPPSSGCPSASASSPRVIYLNAMTFSTQPRTLYQKILAQMRMRGGKSSSTSSSSSPIDEMSNMPSEMECCHILQDMFCPKHGSSIPGKQMKTNKASDMTLLVLDEVDALLSGSNPLVLYSLLEWPFMTGSKLVVISISNNINLLETKLPRLDTRGTKPDRVDFPTYEASELKQILRARIEAVYVDDEEEEEKETPRKKSSEERAENAIISTPRTPTRKRKGGGVGDADADADGQSIRTPAPTSARSNINSDAAFTSPSKKRKTAATEPDHPSSSSSSSPALLHIPLASSSRPLFDVHALDFLTMRLSKGSGDLRKGLEVLRRGVDQLMQQVEEKRKEAAAAATKVSGSTLPSSSTSTTPPPPPPPPELCIDVFSMNMLLQSSLSSSSSGQVSGLQSLPVQQKLLLCTASALRTLHRGHDVLTGEFRKVYERMTREQNLPVVRGEEYEDMLANLGANGYIMIQRSKKRRGGGGGRGGGGAGFRGSGSGSGRGLGSGGGSGSGAIVSLQLNVSLDTLTSAFMGEKAIHRVLMDGQKWARRVLENIAAEAEEAALRAKQQRDELMELCEV